MEWIITVDVEMFDIDQAFKIGQYIDYYQVANFRVNDIVYIIANVEGIKPKLKYVCKVIETHVEFDDEKYFNAYDSSPSEVMVSDFLSRFQLIQEIPNEHRDEFDLEHLNISYTPKKPLKNIGDNKDLFALIEFKLKSLINTPYETDSALQDDEGEKQYSHQRSSFLENFPQDAWESLSFDDFFKNQSLFVNEFNQHLNQDDLLIVKQINNHFFTSKGRINNLETFIEHYRTSMSKSFSDSKTNPIFEIYKHHFITATHYYLDSPFLYEHEVKSLCKLYDLSFNRFKDSMVDVTKKIIELNPEAKDMSSYQLTKWIVSKFKFERVNAGLIENKADEPFKRYISDDDFTKILDLLQRDKHVIVNGLINFGGMKHLKELLIRHGYVEYDSQDVQYYNYLRIISSPSTLSLKSVLEKEESNVSTIVLFDHHRTQVEPFSFQLAIPFFVEYTPKQLIEPSDFIHIEPYLNSIKPTDLFELFNSLNDVIVKNTDKPLCINKVIVKNLIARNDKELVDYLSHRIIPLIKMNQLENDIENDCIDIIYKLIEKHTF